MKEELSWDEKMDEFHAAHPKGCLDFIANAIVPLFPLFSSTLHHMQLRKAGLTDSFFPDLADALYIESVKGMFYVPLLYYAITGKPPGQ